MYKPIQKTIDTGIILKPGGQVKPGSIEELPEEVLPETPECYFERVNDDDEEIVVNTSPSNERWRLVHDGTNVTDLFESGGET